MAPVSDAPTQETGYAAGVAPAWTTSTPGAWTVDTGETAPELTFPNNVAVYDRMRRSDGQIGSTLRAMVMPILGTGWRLVGDDVPAHVMAAARAEFGVDDEATGRARRRRQGITLRDHLRDALLMLPLGFCPFEQVYELGPASPALAAEFPELAGRDLAHVRKLAPRLPRSLLEVRVESDGGLAGIVQTPPVGAPASALSGVFIPADRLVMYVNDREGADWTGTSVLRTAYKHWLIKDQLIRLSAQVVERTGMGVPVVTYPKQGGDRGKALAIAQAFRAGATAGVALEEGYALNLVGVTGSTADALPLIKYHDEAASRALLAMFLDLGHDNGARALGDTFLDFFLMANTAVINNLEDTFTEHVIRDWAALNFGPDVAYPLLKADDLSANSAPTAAALKLLADAGLITADDELEADVRRRHGLPPMGTPRPAPVMPPAFPAPPVVPAAALRDAERTATEHTALQLATPASTDPLVDRLAGLLEQVTALRAGHPGA